MKFSLIAGFLAATLASTVSAQDDIQSKPFKLTAVSTNKTINGLHFYACHAGAAIEALCTTKVQDSYASFFFNTSSEAYTPNPAAGTPGKLVWNLVGGNFVESEALTLIVDPASNVGTPLFYPGDGQAQYVAFDKKNLLNIQSYVDDTVVPAATGATKPYYRWYVCTTYISGYTYQTLNWVYGKAAPQNPTCVKVDVKRSFL